MKRLTFFGSLLLGAASAVLAAGCGDNSARCGDGTYEEDGVCLPDGTATCGQGTIMEPDGTCVPSELVCAEGTVLIEGDCIPEDDTLTADHEEAAEPNDGLEEDDGIAGEFTIDAIGDSTSLHGCVTPYRDLDANSNPDVDYDMWLVTVETPSLIEVTADGVHGLSAGFEWIAASATTLPLIEAGWVRFGINLAGDTSARQVYLPIPGTYALLMSDSRSLFLPDGGAGNAETCYFTSVSRVALPAAIPLLADDLQTETLTNAPIFYSFDPVEGDLIDVQHEIQSAAAAGSVVALRNNLFFNYGESDFRVWDGDFHDPPTISTPIVGGLANTDTITLVVEPVYNYALGPVNYNAMAHPLKTAPLPTDGDTETGIAVVEAFTWVNLDEMLYLWFDVGANEMVKFDMDFDNDIDEGSYDLNMAFFDANLNGISDNLLIDWYYGFGYIDEFDGWVRFPEAGRYYASFFPPDVPVGTEYDITATVDHVAISSMTLGTPVDDAPFNDVGASWRTLDGGTSIWAGVDASATGFEDDVQLDFYDPTAIGVVDLDFGSDPSFTIDNAGADNDYYGRIFFGQPNDFLIRVEDSGGEADASSTYDLSITNRIFSDIGTIALGTPINLPTETSLSAFSNRGGALYFLRGTPGYRLTVTATPADANETMLVDWIDRDEFSIDFGISDAPGEAATIIATVGADGFVALRIGNFEDGTDPTFELDIEAIDPCPGGAILAQTPVGLFAALGDEAITAVQTLPFGFGLFGTNVTNYYVSTNGFISFGAPANDAYYADQDFPNASVPNGLVAPYWDDLYNIEICQVNAANQVTIRWLNGDDFSDTVEFEVVLHDDDTIDFNYGPNQVADGSFASMGAESLNGTSGTQFATVADRSFNTNL